jgi:hypothetical protein
MKRVPFKYISIGIVLLLVVAIICTKARIFTQREPYYSYLEYLKDKSSDRTQKIQLGQLFSIWSSVITYENSLDSQSSWWQKDYGLSNSKRNRKLAPALLAAIRSQNLSVIEYLLLQQELYRNLVKLDRTQKDGVEGLILILEARMPVISFLTKESANINGVVVENTQKLLSEKDQDVLQNYLTIEDLDDELIYYLVKHSK